uniref:Molybdenum cofactor sulfurase middle domain-containing protein n=1 Tax=Plectus sambesii TaxID=2011161 RepID=A0A914UJ80_9BILA
MHLRGNFELAAAAGISIGALAVYELASKSSSFRRWLNDYMDPMVLIGTVGELHIHPIKSSRSHSISEAFCSEVGLRCGELRDRYFVIVNGDTKMAVTALHIPKILLIETAIKDNKLTMMAQQADPTTIDLNDVAQKANVVRVSCKGKQIEGLDCGDIAGAWLQQFLESTEPLRLLYFWPGLFSERQVVVDKNWKFNAVPYRKDEVITLFLVLGACEQNLDDRKFEAENT